MTLLRATPFVLGLALVSAPFSPTARADDHDKKTTMTFTEPVEIPGVHLQGWGVLPPGTYVFKLVNSSSNRHIVQIFNKDQTQIYATILAIPDYRVNRTSKTVVTFNEGLAGKPEAIRTWFYPGENWGEEFVYPKAKAVELARVAQIPVLALKADVPVEVAKPEELEVVTVLQQAPIVAVRPTGEEVEVAQVVQTTPEPIAVAAAAAPAPVQVADNVLPATASSMPLIALFGFLALGGGLTLWVVRKRAL